MYHTAANNLVSTDIVKVMSVGLKNLRIYIKQFEMKPKRKNLNHYSRI
jgi:hypothetical protein